MCSESKRYLTSLITSLCVLALASPLAAQDLEPRAYAASPVGIRFVVAGFGRQTGSILFDPSVPIEDAQATVNAGTVGVGGTFDLFGRTALLVAAMPYVWADASGSLQEVSRSITRSGLGDPRVKLSVNFLGGKALRAREFAAARPVNIIGASLLVLPPLGQYDPAKLVNIGSNRWAFKPEVGFSHAIGKWTVEGYAGVWLFTANNSFYTGNARRTQDPLMSLQAHVSYTVRPRLWVAFDSTWYSGGSTNVNGIKKEDFQRNSRLGATTSLPLTGHQSVKIGFSKGATTRIGGDFTTVAVAWQYSWTNP